MWTGKGAALRRLLISGVLVIGLSAPTVFLLAPTANANGNGTCVKLSGKVTTNVVISNCPQLTKATKKAYKKLTSQTSLLTFATAGGTFMWSGGATIDISAPTVTSPPTDACPGKAGSTSEFVANNATVTAVSDAASGNDPAKVGDAFSATICETNKNGKLKLLPGTKVTI